MASSTIEWTRKTWNPTTGCTKFGRECENCYAEIMSNRLQSMGQEKYKHGFDQVVEHEAALAEPLKWKTPATVFVNSMSDLFHKDVSLEFIQKVFKMMNDTPQHTYQVLTKRAKQVLRYSDKLTWTDNIWMGTSVGVQQSKHRIDSLCKTGAKHKFISFEPLIEHVHGLDLDGIDWVIVGGESGPGARPIKKEWVVSIKQECEAQDVIFYFKQWGVKKNNPNPNDPTMDKRHRYYSKGGNQLDGKTYWANPTIPDATISTIQLFEKEYNVIDEIDGLKTIWELKDHLPSTDIECYKQLKADLNENGQQDPVLYTITDTGDMLVVDGHARIQALIELRKSKVLTQMLTVQFSSLTEVKVWMMKNQLQRRNLSTTDKLKLAYSAKPEIEKIAKANLSTAGKQSKNQPKEDIIPIDTTAEIAKVAGVGRTTAQKYSSVIKRGSNALIKRLHAGDTSISSAYNQLKEEVPEPMDKLQVKTASIVDSLESSPVVKVKPTQDSREFDTVESAMAELKKGHLDVVLITTEGSRKAQLKLSSSIKTGVVQIPVNQAS